MERFDVSPIKINHLAFKLSNSGEPVHSDFCCDFGPLSLIGYAG
jgi:hypothetical protein